MNRSREHERNFKQRALRGLTRYFVYVVYLTLVFAAFTQYRRLILADVGVLYTNYWVALIEALIFAKVIMVGDALNLGRGLEEKPLIVPTIVKTVIFTLLVSIFRLFEYSIRGLWDGSGLTDGLMSFIDKGTPEILAGGLVVFVAFVPFFALRELGRVLGKEGALLALLFKRDTPERRADQGH